MYDAVKGGEAAIEAAHQLVAHERRGDPSVPELTATQIREQLALAVARVMSEGRYTMRILRPLAVKQARGDLIEASFCSVLIAPRCRASAPRSRSIRVSWRSAAASRPPSRTCLADRF